MRAVIIDDEEDARKNLELILSEFSENVDVIGEAGSAMEGVKLIKSMNPDLIFLDIEMPNGNGFDLLDCIDTDNLAIIFVTAYNEHAIKAFQYSAVDYLLKPIDIGLLKKSIDKIESSLFNPGYTKSQLNAMSGIYQNDQKKIAIPTLEGFDFIHIDQLIRVEADRSYAKLYLIGGEKIVVSRSLRDFENVLPKHCFFRPHKSHLININHIRKYIKANGGKIEMEDGFYVDISRSKKEKFAQIIKKV